MSEKNHLESQHVGVIRRLADDTSGNAMMLITAAIIPLMAMIGGGVDMSRAYLAKTRLQQACDAGTLAARKELGTETAVTGVIDPSVAEVGDKFFNLNYQDEAYGTKNRTFQMILEDDYNITGEASVDVPTAIMPIFGYDNIPVSVTCGANLNMTNTDIMMVLDVTGSMRETNPSDTEPRIDVLKATVTRFYDQLQAASEDRGRIRYGFVPYSTNVNVGHLLEDDWVVDEWTYQSREQIVDAQIVQERTYYENWTVVSGTAGDIVDESTYAATYHAASSETESGYYTCDNPTPPDTDTFTYTELSSTTVPYAGPPAGNETTVRERRVRNGIDYWTSLTDDVCTVRYQEYTDYTEEYDKVTRPTYVDQYKWQYQAITRDVSNWRTETAGCMEERDTYEISDYTSVDFSQALDLDIDLVPTAGDPSTQWRPMYPDIVYTRSLKWDGTGTWKKNPVVTADEFIKPQSGGYAACPPQAKKLAEITSGELQTYLDTLNPIGSTYHDIGMIWGGRLLSPTGLFAAENADETAALPTTRHLVYLTDGATEPLDLSYSSYGLEPIDARRWDEGSGETLVETVENRFSVACNEVKKRNITVWVVGFGTSLSDMFKQCAGPGKYFEAADSAQLNDTFASIAEQMGALRVTK